VPGKIRRWVLGHHDQVRDERARRAVDKPVHFLETRMRMSDITHRRV
jgi:hypothetical protein